MNTFTTLEDFVNEYIDKDEYRMSRIRVKSNAYCKFDGPYSEILMVYRLNDNSLVCSKLKKEIENLLTDEGKKMYMDVFSQWYEYERVQKYRNPPAHNCYLSLEVANESKNYVEQQLLILRNLVYKTDYND